jgi:hypothetical protein
MQVPAGIVDKIRKRHDAVSQELADLSPYVFVDQRHLDANTPERAYWHLGYVAALADVLRLLSGEISQRPDSRDISS